MEKIIQLISEKITNCKVLLKSGVYNAKKNTLNITFYAQDGITDKQKNAVFAITKSETESFVDYINIDYIEFNDSEAGILAFTANYLGENYSFFNKLITSENTTVKKLNNNVYIHISVVDIFKERVESSNCIKMLKDILNQAYGLTAEIEFHFCNSDKWVKSVENQSAEFDVANFENIAGGDSYPVLVNGAVVGKCIREHATVISNTLVDGATFIFAGRLTSIDLLTAKSGSDYAKFAVEDITGCMYCMYFIRENGKKESGNTETKSDNTEAVSKYKQALSSLKYGDEVICRGRVSKDVRNGGFVCFVNAITLCSLPSDEVMKKIINKQAYSDYRIIFPQKYVELKQESLFGEKSIDITLNASRGSYVVFDLETTGLNAAQDKIIEIGAIKVVGGDITETFSTLIDPKCEIPPNITQLTGITDKDVEGAPSIEDVMPDFFKFCHGSALVAHNIDFDYKFISEKGKDLNYFFLQRRIDTCQLARERIKGLANYKLNTVADYYRLGDFNHHRAVDDALVCCKIFLQLY